MALSAGPGMLAAPASQPIPASNKCSPNTSSRVASSPPRIDIDIPAPILEADETESEGPVEPITPVSGRQSQDFVTLRHAHDQDHDESSSVNNHSDKALNQQNPVGIVTGGNKVTVVLSSEPVAASPSSSPVAAPPKPPYRSVFSKREPLPSVSVSKPDSAASSSELVPTTSNSNKSFTNLTPTSSRPSTRGHSAVSLRSARSIKSVMTNLFRRSGAPDAAVFDSESLTASESARPATRSSRFSFTRSSTTTRSNSPPTPGTGTPPLETAQADEPSLGDGNLLSAEDFKKTNRASTGFSLRGRTINFAPAVGRNGGKPASRRANSFDASNRSPAPVARKPNDQTYPPERAPWALPPDAGTGVKARRMSLSLPDDFNVDVAELLDEYEYQSKLLGRHGKHLGKGAASKVTLMVRKGSPGEMYAVKEFRRKSGRESQEEYEKKIKSEFSIGKSLHHPNIVETIRLCTDHGRWNHVMEYCSEGDLFSLVQKGHLKGEAKLKDRLCLFKQLLQGVNYLHANGIAHRDIKLENLLITRDSKLKIADFGVSEVFCGTHPGLREAGGQCGKNMGEIRLCAPGLCGSEPYIAPEVLEKKGNYDPRALDVWSVAIVMIYMTFGGAIWSRAEAGNLHYDKLVAGWDKWYRKHHKDATIAEGDYPHCQALDVGVSPPPLRRIMLQMLNPNPNKRMCIYDVISHRWIKNIECCQLESYEDPKLQMDVTKKPSGGKSGSKIFYHNHLPTKNHGSHSLGKMPGQAGY